MTMLQTSERVTPAPHLTPTVSAAMHHDLPPPVDVINFKALVRLAETAGQVILHHQADAVDTYLVNDNGTAACQKCPGKYVPRMTT